MKALARIPSIKFRYGTRLVPSIKTSPPVRPSSSSIFTPLETDAYFLHKLNSKLTRNNLTEFEMECILSGGAAMVDAKLSQRSEMMEI